LEGGDHGRLGSDVGLGLGLIEAKDGLGIGLFRATGSGLVAESLVSTGQIPFVTTEEGTNDEDGDDDQPEHDGGSQSAAQLLSSFLLLGGLSLGSSLFFLTSASVGHGAATLGTGHRQLSGVFVF
jgi:hypothetical protein